MSAVTADGAEFPEEMAGMSDGFERLWTPHRLAYVKDASERQSETPKDGCPFCLEGPDQDEQRLVIARGEHCFVILNLFPYNPGHLMVCPYRHVGLFTEASTAERNEIAELTAHAMRVLKRASGAQGFNVGMNQGAVGGAGIAEHLHQHVVPRWMGDSNFLPIVAKTKALPELLDDTRRRLADAWREE